MGPEIVFVPSAFKHKFSEENIRWVLLNHLVDGIIEEDNETKYMYNFIDEKTIKVFHAMRCRKQFYEKLKEQEKLWQT